MYTIVIKYKFTIYFFNYANAGHRELVPGQTVCESTYFYDVVTNSSNLESVAQWLGRRSLAGGLSLIYG